MPGVTGARYVEIATPSHREVAGGVGLAPVAEALFVAEMALAEPADALIATASTARGWVVLPAASFRVTATSAAPEVDVVCEAGVRVIDVGLPVVVKAKETVSTTPAEELALVVK